MKAAVRCTKAVLNTFRNIYDSFRGNTNINMSLSWFVVRRSLIDSDLNISRPHRLVIRVSSFERQSLSIRLHGATSEKTALSSVSIGKELKYNRIFCYLKYSIVLSFTTSVKVNWKRFRWDGNCFLPESIITNTNAIQKKSEIHTIIYYWRMLLT